MRAALVKRVDSSNFFLGLRRVSSRLAAAMSECDRRAAGGRFGGRRRRRLFPFVGRGQPSLAWRREPRTIWLICGGSGHSMGDAMERLANSPVQVNLAPIVVVSIPLDCSCQCCATTTTRTTTTNLKWPIKYRRRRCQDGQRHTKGARRPKHESCNVCGTLRATPVMKSQRASSHSHGGGGGGGCFG